MQTSYILGLREGLSLVLLLFLPLFMPAQADISGHWEGHIDIMGDRLEVLIDFEETAEMIEGNISIPAQNLRNLSLINIKVTADSAWFTISEVGGDPTFIGAYAPEGAELSGIFLQYGQQFPFLLHKEEAPSTRAFAALDGLDTVIERSMESYRLPGLALAIVADGETIYEKGFGYRDVEGQKPVTINTLFAIGSSTKAFTTLTLGTLVDEGLIAWDQPVREYIPWFRMHEDDLTDHLTVRDLVTHRSGLPRHDMLWYNNEDDSREELVRSLRYLETNAGLRERLQYNNLMYLTAGYLTGFVTGSTWEETVRDRIFRPLGMSRSNFSVARSMDDPDHALPYREKQDSLVEMSFRDISTVGPAGSINSSVKEMSRWVSLQLNGGTYEGNELINPTLISDMHTPYMPMGSEHPRPDISARSYGLGWMIDTWRGHKRVEHGGNIDGFSALVTLFPDDGIGMVILCNKNGSALPSSLSQHIADRLLELEPEPWIEKGLKEKKKAYAAMEEAGEKKEADRRPGTSFSHERSDYTGKYEHPGYGAVTVEYDGDSLYMNYHGIRTSLEHWHFDVFNGKHSPDPVFEDMKMQFESNLDGYISAVHIPLEEAVQPIVFKKRPSDKWYDPSFIDRFTGKYSFMGQTVTVRRVGDALRMNVPGQPEYTLQPDLGDQFHLKDYPSIQVLFREDDKGDFILVVDQPQGRFEAKPIEEE